MGGPNKPTTFDYPKTAAHHVVVVDLLNGAWFGIPESLGAWDLPGFGALCDLCSECHCVYGDEEIPKND